MGQNLGQTLGQNRGQACFSVRHRETGALRRCGTTGQSDKKYLSGWDKRRLSRFHKQNLSQRDKHPEISRFYENGTNGRLSQGHKNFFGERTAGRACPVYGTFYVCSEICAFVPWVGLWDILRLSCWRAGVSVVHCPVTRQTASCGDAIRGCDTPPLPMDCSVVVPIGLTSHNTVTGCHASRMAGQVHSLSSWLRSDAVSSD